MFYDFSLATLKETKVYGPYTFLDYYSTLPKLITDNQERQKKFLSLNKYRYIKSISEKEYIYHMSSDNSEDVLELSVWVTAVETNIPENVIMRQSWRHKTVTNPRQNVSIGESVIFEFIEEPKKVSDEEVRKLHRLELINEIKRQEKEVDKAEYKYNSKLTDTNKYLVNEDKYYKDSSVYKSMKSNKRTVIIKNIPQDIDPRSIKKILYDMFNQYITEPIIRVIANKENKLTNNGIAFMEFRNKDELDSLLDNTSKFMIEHNIISIEEVSD